MASNSDFKKGPGTIGEEAAGLGQRIKGTAKVGAGKLTGDEQLEREGRIDQAVGNIRQATNDVVDTTRDDSYRSPSYGSGTPSSYGSGTTPYDSRTTPAYGSGTVAEEAAGLGQRIKGAVKEGAGKISGNERLEREGRADRIEGNIRQETNDVLGTDRDDSFLSSSRNTTFGESDLTGTDYSRQRDVNYGAYDSNRSTASSEYREPTFSATGSREYGTSSTLGSNRATGRLVSGVFNDRDQAERAWHDLKDRYGFSDNDISIVMSDTTRQKYFGNVRPGSEFKHDKDSKAIEGLGVGSALGGTLGAIVGAIAAIGTNLIIPGAGLVLAGPIAAAFAGAGAGGVAGGLIGSLVGAGIPEDQAREYDQHIRGGSIVLGVHARDEKQAQDLESYFRTHGGTVTQR